MGSGVHFKHSLSVEIHLNENIKKIEITDLPTNVKVTALRQKIFAAIEIADECSYKLLFSQTHKSLTNRNIQQIFKGQEGYVILNKEAGEESVLVNSDKSTSSNASEKIEGSGSQDSSPLLPSSSTDKAVETPQPTVSKAPSIPRFFVQMSSREKRNVGVIFALALLVLAYSARRYFYRNAKSKPSLQEIPKALSQKV